MKTRSQTFKEPYSDPNLQAATHIQALGAIWPTEHSNTLATGALLGTAILWGITAPVAMAEASDTSTAIQEVASTSFTIFGVVAASDLAASRTFLTDHGRGEVGDPRSPEKFAKGIRGLLAEADKLSVQVKEAAERAASSLSWERTCAPELQRLVESLQR